MYDDSVLASGGEDCLVKLWDTNQALQKEKGCNAFKTLIAHSRPIWGVARVTEDYLATGSWDHTVKIWTTKPQEKKKPPTKKEILEQVKRKMQKNVKPYDKGL